MDLTQFEINTLRTILSGDHPTKVELRSQLNGLIATSRCREGIGCFTNLAVAAGTQPLSRPKFVEYDAYATHPNLENGGEFILFVQEGFLSMLEGVAYTGNWPDNDDGFHVRPREVTQPAVMKKS